MNADTKVIEDLMTAYSSRFSNISVQSIKDIVESSYEKGLFDILNYIHSAKTLDANFDTDFFVRTSLFHLVEIMGNKA